jgi:hypothetical protein
VWRQALPDTLVAATHWSSEAQAPAGDDLNSFKKRSFSLHEAAREGRRERSWEAQSSM